jgi:molybdopterin-dependent oxidoreductase alpha subunit
MSEALVTLRKRPSTLRRAGAAPFGMGRTKPAHFREMLRIAWENRGHLGYAYRVLSQGACDGCALGTSGLHDWTVDGTHLCLVRLNLLRLNTLDALPLGALDDVAKLGALDGKALRELGRIPHPLRRRRGEPGFTRIDWATARAELGARLGGADPDRVACYMTSRGVGNEAYFAAQKALRLLGSPHIDNAARLCHSPSTAAMKRVLGVAASTCSYRDFFDTDLIVFFGSNPANDQPVVMKYLVEARRRGVRVASVNVHDEPGLRSYWVPSDLESAVFGSVLSDAFFGVTTGGDQAFLYAVQRRLIARGAVDHAFVAAHTEGFPAFAEALAGLDEAELCRRAGTSAAEVERFVELLASAERAVLVWSMGLTQHAHGTQTVEALCGLGLLRGYVGRAGCGLMPIRGHSGVQGGAEMGAYATAFPGGVPIDAAGADRLQALWGFRPPEREGLDAASMLEAADAGNLEVLYAIGGNFLDTLPRPSEVRRALSRVPVRIHQDIVLNHAMLVEPLDSVYLLPARTRYEHRGGVTQTSTERRVIFSPHVPGHDVGEALEEWRIVVELVQAARPEQAALLRYDSAAAVRADIAATVPAYAGVERLEKQGDVLQWGGPRLCEGGQFPLAGGRARFVFSEPPERRLEPGQFHMSTRRGKQFNAMVQAERDMLTGAERDHLLMHVDDMRALGVAQHARVRVSSACGALTARAFAAPIQPGNVQLHWPEANPLIESGRRDPGGRVPDYNALVRVEAIDG